MAADGHRPQEVAQTELFPTLAHRVISQPVGYLGSFGHAGAGVSRHCCAHSTARRMDQFADSFRTRSTWRAICLKEETGAGEGIRTLDPDLGKDHD